MIFSKDTPPDLGTGQTSNAQASENTRILALIAQDYLKDRKSKRRWGILIKMLVLGYVAATAWVYFQSADPAVDSEHTALVEIDGVVGPGENSADLINESLANAFAAPGARGVIVKINSPGGTPVQAAQIAKALGIKIYTIGAGTRGIAPVPVRRRDGTMVLKRTRVFIDEDTLKNIATITGGHYFRATDSAGLEAIYAEIDALEKTANVAEQYQQYAERFGLALLPGLGLLLLEMVLVNTRFRTLP